jgi:hypothetical protein
LDLRQIRNEYQVCDASINSFAPLAFNVLPQAVPKHLNEKEKLSANIGSALNERAHQQTKRMRLQLRTSNGQHYAQTDGLGHCTLLIFGIVIEKSINIEVKVVETFKNVATVLSV